MFFSSLKKLDSSWISFYLNFFIKFEILIFSFKALGGGMRQAGVLAAAAHVALDGVEERLWADHENAKIILKGFIFIWSYTWKIDLLS